MSQAGLWRITNATHAGRNNDLRRPAMNTTPAPVRPLRDPRRQKLDRVYEAALEAFLYPGMPLEEVQAEVGAAYVESKRD
jgi:hypothetical protein